MRGHFSTPPLLVERILDACGYTSDKDLSPIRVLDPACGSGNFLAGAASRLLSSERRKNLSCREQSASVQGNIWGFDPDPVACFLAEMRVRALLPEESEGDHTAAALHIHQADGLTFPWEQHANVDLFLANPPYLAAKNNDLSGYQFARQRGQADSYLLFLNLALQIVRPGGWIGLVIPDPVLARTNARLERQRLLTETTLHHLWHISGVFSAYVGAAVIIAQKSPPRPIHQVAWQREVWPRLSQDVTKPAVQMHEHLAAPSVTRSVPQSLLRNQPGAEMRYLLSGAQNSLVEKLHAFHYTLRSAQERPFLPLGEIVVIRRGEELSKNSTYLFKTEPREGCLWYPVLRGGSAVRPYMVPGADSWIAREHIAKSMEHYLSPKLLVVKSTSRLQATLDLRSHVVLQTLYLLYLRSDENVEQGERQSDGAQGDGAQGDRPASRSASHPARDGSSWEHLLSEHPLWEHPSPDRPGVTNSSQISRSDELYFLLALLNSRLLQEYVYVLHTAYKWVQPQIEQHVLTHLPIPTIGIAEKARISEYAKALMHACGEKIAVVELSKEYKQMYEELERAVCALYEQVLKSC